MKKALFILAFVFMVTGMFALPWEEASNNLMSFFDKGNAIYIADSDSNLRIYPKHSVRRIEVDTDEVEIVITKGDDEEKYSFKINKHKLSLDPNGNLIITKK